MKRSVKPLAADSLETVAAREAESGGKHDTAILQILREHVWRNLVRGGDPEELSKIIALIIAARRQNLAEKNASPDGLRGVEEWLNENVESELRVAPESPSTGKAL